MGATQPWGRFADRLREAEATLLSEFPDLSDDELADGRLALLRALSNQLSRAEVDREHPELVPFNGWRQRLLMDNPDTRYWLAEIRDNRRYEITGSFGGAIYGSLTTYRSSGGVAAESTGRVDVDDLDIDSDGRFSVTLSRDRPEGTRNWLPLAERSSVVWVRHFHDRIDTDAPGWCHIAPIDEPPIRQRIDPTAVERVLERIGATTAALPTIWARSTADDAARPNEIRRWSEMSGGAAFTEPAIDYLRGGWSLSAGEALVIEGEVPRCRCWNVVLYNRFLNSLDLRYRRSTVTGARVPTADSRYRIVLAPSDPGVDTWLDTEGRPFGVFVIRFAQATAPIPLPTVRVSTMSDLT